ncbi:nucleolar pre-ribosomal-associated protein 1-like isoform 1-T5 [Acridotheres tristis]
MKVTIEKDLYPSGFCILGVLRFIYTLPPLFPGQVLRDSGAFEYTWKEISIWLEHLDNTKEDQKEAVIQFLERILLELVTNPCPYTDKAADLVQAASVLQVALFKQDSDNISIPVSHIDDVLDMVDVLIEDRDGFDEEGGFSLNEDVIISLQCCCPCCIRSQE